MKKYRQFLRQTDLKFLICSLFSLSKNHKFFKKLNLNKNRYLNDTESYLNNSDNFNDLKQLTSKPSIRRFSYNLVKPILLSTFFSSTNQVTNKDSTTALKKYLRLFKYNYQRYFVSQNANFNNIPTHKELNMIAIKYLFLLSGI